MAKARGLYLACFLVTATMTQSALACAVCFSAKNEASRFAFIITTVGLTVLPLLFIAWGVWWVVKRERAQEPFDDAARKNSLLVEGGSPPQGMASALSSTVQST